MEIFTWTINGWKLLPTVMKSSILDTVGFVDPPLVRMKYSFRSIAEVYYALHNLFEDGEAAPNFRKS